MKNLIKIVAALSLFITAIVGCLALIEKINPVSTRKYITIFDEDDMDEY